MNINGIEITVGADPEIFIGHGPEPVSAYGVVPGTKQEPFRVERGAVQVDGMATEFNIDPANTSEEFQLNLTTVMNQLKSMIGDCEFIDTASIDFSDEIIKTQPLEALLLGCEPDYNAYTLEENPTPVPPGNMRTAGGHIHIGGLPSDDPQSPQHLQTMSRLIKAMDECIGTYSIFWDRDDRRRSMYGMAGAMRPKSYGVEYRSLSNKWIFNENLVKFVYDGVARSLERAFDVKWKPQSVSRNIINFNMREPFQVFDAKLIKRVEDITGMKAFKI